MANKGTAMHPLDHAIKTQIGFVLFACLIFPAIASGFATFFEW